MFGGNHLPKNHILRIQLTPAPHPENTHAAAPPWATFPIPDNPTWRAAKTEHKNTAKAKTLWIQTPWEKDPQGKTRDGKQCRYFLQKNTDFHKTAAFRKAFLDQTIFNKLKKGEQVSAKT